MDCRATRADRGSTGVPARGRTLRVFRPAEYYKASREVAYRWSRTGNHGDSRRPAGSGPCRGVARDRVASSREYEDGVAADANAFRTRARLHGVPALVPEQDSAGRDAGRPRFSGTGTDSARDRKTAARDSGIAARIFTQAGRGWRGAG